MEFAEVERGGERLYLPGFGGDVSNAAVAAARQGAKIADLHGPRRRRLRARTSSGSGTRKASTAPSVIVAAEAGEPASISSPMVRKGTSSPMRAPAPPRASSHRGAAARADRGGARAARLRHQPGDLRKLRRRGVRRDPPREGERHGGQLRHQSAPAPLAPRPGPRHDPRRCRARRHRPAGARRRAQQLTGLDEPEEICGFYLGLGCRIVALTMGKDGHHGGNHRGTAGDPGATRRGGRCHRRRRHLQRQFPGRMAPHGDPFRAAAYANVAAALSTLGKGAVAPIPTREAVERFLRA